MYKLIAVYLLLLSLGGSQAAQNKVSSSIVSVSGATLFQNKYYVNLNQEFQVVVSTSGDAKTNITWKVDFSSGNGTAYNTKTTRSTEKKGQLIKSTLTLLVTEDVNKITWSVSHPNHKKPTQFEVPFFIHMPIPPTVSWIGPGKSEECSYHVHEKDDFRLRCRGGGMKNFTINWLDSEGLPVVSNDFLNISAEKDMKNKNAIIPFGGSYLDVRPQRGMKAFGCQVDSPLFAEPLTHWVNLTVIHPLNVTLSADNSTCGQMTFTCHTEAIFPEKVTYEWLLNDNVTITGGFNLTTMNDEIDLETVYCAATDDYGSSDAMLDVTGIIHHCGLHVCIIYSLIAGAILVVVIIVGCIIRKVYCSNKIPPLSIIYNVASQAKESGLSIVRESMKLSNKEAYPTDYTTIEVTV